MHIVSQAQLVMTQANDSRMPSAKLIPFAAAIAFGFIDQRIKGRGLRIHRGNSLLFRVVHIAMLVNDCFDAFSSAMIPELLDVASAVQVIRIQAD